MKDQQNERHRNSPPLAAVVEAINGGDTKRFLGLFTADGVVDDWGSCHVGRDAIRRWSDRELIGAKGVMTARAASRSERQITVIGDWKSNFYSGPGRFVFTIAGGKVVEWRITAE